MIVGTCQRCKPSKRNWRNDSLSLVERFVSRRNSRIHCMHRIPARAAVRDKETLVNQIMFTITAQRGGANGGDNCTGVRVCAEGLPSWVAI